VKAQPASGSGASWFGRATPLVLARLCSAVITFCIPLVLARAFALEDYGTYKQFVLIANTLYYALPFGIAQSLYFFIPRTDEKRAYFGQTLFFLLAVGCVGAAVVLAFSDTLAGSFSNPALIQYRGELALYVLGMVGSCALEYGLTTQGKTRASAACYLVSDSIRAASMVLPVLLGFGLTGTAWAMAAFACARLVVAWAVLLGTTTGRVWDGRLFVSQLAYAAPFGAAMALAIPQQYAHQFAVSAAVSPELFALYAVGCFQLPLVDLLYTPTSEMLMVRLGELEKEGRVAEGVAAFREASAKLAYAFLPMAAFLFAAAPEFIAALFGARYLPAVPVFRISVLSVVLSILPLDGTLRARNHTRHIFLSYLVKALATVPLVYFGVKRFGMLGGIGAWAIAELVGKLTLFGKVPAALSTPERRVGLREMLPMPQLARAIGAAVVAVAGVWLARLGAGAVGGLPEGFLWRFLPLAGAGFLYVTGYVCLLWMVGVRPLTLLASVRRKGAT
jgi:O-antigen/teichoic acid export membrane protein